jgi:ABC-type transporter Mla MlaB component
MGMQVMTCSAFRQNGCLLIPVTGQLDSSNATEIREQCIGHIGESDAEVVVDLTDLEFIDRTGLDVLLVVYRSLESMGPLDPESPWSAEESLRGPAERLHHRMRHRLVTKGPAPIGRRHRLTRDTPSLPLHAESIVISSRWPLPFGRCPLN